MALTATAEQSISKRGAIIGLILASHLLGYWIMESGLSRAIVELVAPPVETKIIDEEKVEEPPPPPPPPPDMPVEPPPFIPPPEVNVQVATQTNAIQVVTNEKPPEAPPAPAAPAPVSTKPSYDRKKSRSSDEFYPSDARRNDQEGTAVVRCLIQLNGRCADPQVLTSSGVDSLDKAALKYATEGLRFIPGTTGGAAAPMPFDFKVTFKLTR